MDTHPQIETQKLLENSCGNSVIVASPVESEDPVTAIQEASVDVDIATMCTTEGTLSRPHNVGKVSVVCGRSADTALRRCPSISHPVEFVGSAHGSTNPADGVSGQPRAGALAGCRAAVTLWCFHYQ